VRKDTLPTACSSSTASLGWRSSRVCPGGRRQQPLPMLDEGCLLHACVRASLCSSATAPCCVLGASTASSLPLWRGPSPTLLLCEREGRGVWLV
jgi:hypothetical protein